MKLKEFHKLLLICLTCGAVFGLPLAVTGALALRPQPVAAPAGAQNFSTLAAKAAPVPPSQTFNWLVVVLPLAAAAVAAGATARLLARRRSGPAMAAARQSERLGVLYAASQAISHSLDEEQVYAAIYQAVGQVMSNEALVIALLDDDQQRIHGVYLMDRGERRPPLSNRVGEGLAGHVLAKRQPLRLDSAADWPAGVVHYGDADSVQSVLAVPMQAGERVFGMLATESYRPHAFAPEDVPLLSTLANQAAAAIQNARQFQAARQQLATLTLLHEIAQATVSAATVDGVVSQAVAVLERRLNYEIIGAALVDAGGKPGRCIRRIAGPMRARRRVCP